VGKLKEFGIELLDLRLKRVNYNPDVLDRIYQRMISERLQIAQRFRSEGEGEAAKIAGRKEMDLQEIRSGAYRKVQQIRGEADAKASEIYARSYNQDPQTAEFYQFLRTLQLYPQILTSDTQLVLSTDAPVLKLLKEMTTVGERAP
jgi:membrane protease subunit HflC